MRLKAFALALLCAVALRWIVVPDICRSLEPGTFLYWLLGCDKDTGGGGDSGAG